MKYDFSFDAVIDRLKNALHLSSYKDVGSKLGLASNAFYNRKSSKSLPFEEIIQLCEKEKISLDWIFFGQGMTFIEDKVEDQLTVGIDKNLFVEIAGELEQAFLGDDEKNSKNGLLRTLNAGTRSAVIVYIYNEVSSIENIKERSLSIRDHAKEMARTHVNIKKEYS